MADVAGVAGVSHQTVSRVLHDSPHVRPETRDRVLAAIAALDYRPNSAAQALVTGRTRTLGVVSFDSSLFGPTSTLFAIERAAHAADHYVSIASLGSITAAAVLDAVERLRRQGVDGVIVIAPHERLAEGLAQLPAALRVASVAGGAGAGIPVVQSDQAGGAAQATRHLLELGHRTVWHIAGPTSWVEAQQREQGWRAALEAAGAEIPEPRVGDWTTASGHAIAWELGRDPEVTAIFAANDQMAMGVLRALHELGRHVPREVSVVGFDDIPEASFFTPPLTTVHQDFRTVGRRSVALVLGTPELPPAAPPCVTVPVELKLRASTAPPAGG
jgi:DNA-binding LacI/PurR family transcriptional regulator